MKSPSPIIRGGGGLFTVSRKIVSSAFEIVFGIRSGLISLT
jgi:hypothetical protein